MHIPWPQTRLLQAIASVFAFGAYLLLFHQVELRVSHRAVATVIDLLIHLLSFLGLALLSNVTVGWLAYRIGRRRAEKQHEGT
jgi:hypothetical protein